MRKTSEANAIIIEYTALCEKRGEVLDPTGFLELWMAANAIAEMACLDGEPPPGLIDRILAGEA